MANVLGFADVVVGISNGTLEFETLPTHDGEGKEILRLGTKYTEETAELIEIFRPMLASSEPMTLADFLKVVRNNGCNFTKGYGNYSMKAMGVLGKYTVQFVMQTPQGMQLTYPNIWVS